MDNQDGNRTKNATRMPAEESNDGSPTINPSSNEHARSGVQIKNSSLFVFEEGNADDSIIGGNSDDIGDLGDSNKEGQEADIHNDGLNLRTVLEG